jgi:archaellum component FlaC
MTTDERIDRLTERHEALTQSVEMLTTDIRELKDAAASLLRIAEIHEARISRLEDQDGDELTQ